MKPPPLRSTHTDPDGIPTHRTTYYDANGKVELTMDTIVCADDPCAVKCPRCWKWHHVVTNTRASVASIKDTPPECQVLCDSCESVLLEAYPEHCSSLLIRAHREAANDPYRRAIA